MKKCGPEGRDCIKRNSAKSFNCSTACEGIHADIQWIEKQIEEDIKDEKEEQSLEVEFKAKADGELLKRLADLEEMVKLIKNGGGEKGEEVDKEKYKMLVAEYRKFKAKNVKHFRFNAVADSCAFGRSKCAQLFDLLL